jgi:hypothetical protein
MTSSRQPDPARRERWGYFFKLTDDHLSDDEVQLLRAHYDELGSAALENLQAIVACEKAESGHSNSTVKTDMYMVLEKHHDDDETLSKFWKEVQTIPAWVDLAQIERGQKFFARYAMANCMGLAIQGFIRENSVRQLLILTFSSSKNGPNTLRERQLLGLLRFLRVLAASQPRTSSLVSSRPSRG